MTNISFEKEISKYVGAKYSVVLTSCTAGLHLASIVSKINKGKVLLTSPITFVATANSVLLTGATPVLADVNYDDMNISLNSIKQSITSKTIAILPVHLAGKICKMTQIKKIAKKYGLKYSTIETIIKRG